MLKKFILNAANSYVTSGMGIAFGMPDILKGLEPLWDGDAATGILWAPLRLGLGILFAGLMARDWTKGWTARFAAFFKKK